MVINIPTRPSTKLVPKKQQEAQGLGHGTPHLIQLFTKYWCRWILHMEGYLLEIKGSDMELYWLLTILNENKGTFQWGSDLSSSALWGSKVSCVWGHFVEKRAIWPPFFIWYNKNMENFLYWGEISGTLAQRKVVQWSPEHCLFTIVIPIPGN